MPKSHRFDKKYDESFCSKLVELRSQGLDISAVCVELNISRETYYNWQDEYPEFKAAVVKGTEACKRWWFECARNNMTNKHFNDRQWSNMVRLMFEMPEKGRKVSLPELRDCTTVEEKQQVIEAAISDGRLTDSEAANVLKIIECSIKAQEHDRLVKEIEELKVKLEAN